MPRSKAGSTHLVAGKDLAVGLLHLAQLPQEVPAVPQTRQQSRSDTCVFDISGALELSAWCAAAPTLPLAAPVLAMAPSCTAIYRVLLPGAELKLQTTDQSLLLLAAILPRRCSSKSTAAAAREPVPTAGRLPACLLPLLLCHAAQTLVHSWATCQKWRAARVPRRKAARKQAGGRRRVVLTRTWSVRALGRWPRASCGRWWAPHPSQREGGGPPPGTGGTCSHPEGSRQGARRAGGGEREWAGGGGGGEPRWNSLHRLALAARLAMLLPMPPLSLSRPG